MKQKKEEKMETQVAMKEPTNAVSVSHAMTDSGITSSDLIIPKLLLMQNTSESVGDGAAKLCDVINSQTLEVIGGLNTPVEIIPLKLVKTWRIYDMSGGQPEFMRQEAVTPANVNLPWDGVEEGITIRRDLCMNFHVLLLNDVKKGEAFPCVVSFKRTSMQAGKQLATHLFKMAALGRLPYSQSLELKVSKKKQETNTYGIFELGKGTPLTSEHQEVAAKWVDMLQSMTYKVDDDADKEAPAKVAAPIVVGGSSDMKF